MVKQLEKYEKKAERSVKIKTDDFNGILRKLGTSIRVIPRDEDIKEGYRTYRSLVVKSPLFDPKKDKPVTLEEYEKNFYFSAISYDMGEITAKPAEAVLKEVLGLKSICVKYAADRHGQMTGDTLELRYVPVWENLNDRR